jgi:hypothetical protein
LLLSNKLAKIEKLRLSKPRSSKKILTNPKLK